MLTVHFKTGQTLDINQEVAKSLRERIIDGAKKFQFFSDASSNDVVHMINLEEILFITESEKFNPKK